MRNPRGVFCQLRYKLDLRLNNNIIKINGAKNNYLYAFWHPHQQTNVLYKNNYAILSLTLDNKNNYFRIL